MHRILLAEDDNDMRRFLVKALQNAGYDVASFDNGLSAYNRLREEPFELLLTDIVMPEVSGIELTERINQDFDEVFVIVISSLSQEHVVLEAIGAGAADFISKPINQQQLADSLHKIMTQTKIDSM